MDRRITIKWMLAAAGAIPISAVPMSLFNPPASQPYGPDPKLLQVYHPGDLWPLTFTATQRTQAMILCDTIIPADATSPSAFAVGVVDFIDEWISAPYPEQRRDRKTVLEGLAWLEAESLHRFSKVLPDLAPGQLHQICDDICYVPKARPDFLEGARFFARYRDLTTGGFYTTPQGRADLRYLGNTPQLKFEGPPPEVLRKVGLA
jgi:hypothetical protein